MEKYVRLKQNKEQNNTSSDMELNFHHGEYESAN